MWEQPSVVSADQIRLEDEETESTGIGAEEKQQKLSEEMTDGGSGKEPGDVGRRKARLRVFFSFT